MDIHFDMETQDPDDVFTLCLLATHPNSNLKGVTVFPGGLDQVGLVKHVLKLLGRADIPVGAAGLDDGKGRVSGFYYKWLGIAAGLTFNPLAAAWAVGHPFRSKGEWGFRTLEELHGNPREWPPGAADNARSITTRVDTDLLYESWVA